MTFGVLILCNYFVILPRQNSEGAFECLTGTTCATVLTRAIFTEGCKSVAAGMNAMDLRRGINMAVDAVGIDASSVLVVVENIAVVSCFLKLISLGPYFYHLRSPLFPILCL